MFDVPEFAFFVYVYYRTMHMYSAVFVYLSITLVYCFETTELIINN